MEASVLKLLAEDSEGLGIIAAAVQDALVKPQDIKFDKRARTFGLEINRFQWESGGQAAALFPFARGAGVCGRAESVRSTGVLQGCRRRATTCSTSGSTPAAEPPGGT